MEKQIIDTIKYFLFFNYPPTAEEIYCFLKIRATKAGLTSILQRMVKKGVLARFSTKKLPILKQDQFFKRQPLNSCRFSTSQIPPHRYTLGEYIKSTRSIRLKAKKSGQRLIYDNWHKRYVFSIKKLKDRRFRLYLKLLWLFPQIKLVGLSGSIAMMNADEDDDIDLFMITAKDRLFTGRLIAIVLAKLLGIHRGWQKSRQHLPFSPSLFTDKVCLNLFLEERDLAVPNFKKTEYVGHEILQMKPIINKDRVWERLLVANNWVFKIFPNAKSMISNFKWQILNQFQNSNFKNLADYIEEVLKKFQLSLINKHKTSEIITSRQLWFHPEDFSRKINLLKKSS